MGKGHYVSSGFRTVDEPSDYTWLRAGQASSGKDVARLYSVSFSYHRVPKLDAEDAPIEATVNGKVSDHGQLVRDLREGCTTKRRQ